MATAKEIFISKIAPLVQAERIKREKWVLPSVCIAQAILETGWGKSSLMVNANAYFGIKATKSWKGKVYSSKTQECYDGINFTTETACFRAYDSLADSIADYFDLICTSSRYKAAVNNPNAESSITAIKNGGYATDPNYISKIMNLINTYDLTRFDAIEEIAEPIEPTKPTEPLKSITDIAKEVIKGKWGNGEERKERLTNAGYDYATVQNEVNRLLKKPTEPTEPLKSITDIAKEVIKGNWGNGTERKERLTNAGYDYATVQREVNRLLAKPTEPLKSIMEIAKEVIKGKWGNGEERKRKLKDAGYDYDAVQSCVNSLLK